MYALDHAELLALWRTAGLDKEGGGGGGRGGRRHTWCRAVASWLKRCARAARKW